MATVPPEDQRLIDQLNVTIAELQGQEVEAAKNRNESRRQALHHHILLIHGLIKSITEYHINQQNPRPVRPVI
jgi:hypothetical protein